MAFCYNPFYEIKYHLSNLITVSKTKWSIMTNEDPYETIKTLCQIKTPFVTWDTYKEIFESHFNEEKPISPQHNDAHFYLLSQFGLIIKVDDLRYRISSTARYLCNLLNDIKKEKEFQRALSSMLLTNSQKGELFNNFLNHLQRSKTKKELKEKFPVETYRTLIAWCERANLITVHDSYCAATPKKPEKKYTIKEFWNELVNTYKEIQETNVFGSKRIYVPVDEIRLRVSCQLGFYDPATFDNFLIDALSHKEYRLHIRLHGAPPHAYAEMKSFEHNRKSYPLFSLAGI